MSIFEEEMNGLRLSDLELSSGFVSGSLHPPLSTSYSLSFNVQAIVELVRRCGNHYRFTYEELADIHLAYGASYSNALAAHWIYEEHFPGRQLSDSWDL